MACSLFVMGASIVGDEPDVMDGRGELLFDDLCEAEMSVAESTCDLKGDQRMDSEKKNVYRCKSIAWRYSFKSCFNLYYEINTIITISLINIMNIN